MRRETIADEMGRDRLRTERRTNLHTATVLADIPAHPEIPGISETKERKEHLSDTIWMAQDFRKIWDQLKGVVRVVRVFGLRVRWAMVRCKSSPRVLLGCS